jgi:hypothetical protein
MSEMDFELSIITTQKNSFEVLKILKDSKLPFDLVSERGFAPSSPEIAIQILTLLGSLLPLVSELFTKIWAKDGGVKFETRRKLAHSMLQHLAPLLEVEVQDKKDHSYYVFTTAKGLYFWELDRGEITYGPLKRSK